MAGRKTSTAPAPRQVTYLPLDEVPPAPRNPKQHDLDELRKSVEEFGFVTPGIIDGRTGLTVVGHGRTAVLREMLAEGNNPPAGITVAADGRWMVPFITGWSSVSDEQAEKFLVADNRHAELGGWDTSELADMMGSWSSLDGTGYDPGELEDMVKTLEPPDLDALAEQVGDPDPADTWPSVRVKCAPWVAAAWRTVVDKHDGDEPAAFASLLGVDPDSPPETDWQP